MYRTYTCGELRITDVNKSVVLCGWVQRIARLGGVIFLNLRDHYGVTQLIFDQKIDSILYRKASDLGREWVIQINGTVVERSNRNLCLPTGDVEIIVKEFCVLNPSACPPFTIEENTDGGEDLRMKYRYLDLRRIPLHENLKLRHQITFAVRRYLNHCQFLEIETPALIGSTPEGARDFLVPSRINPGEFYALPQSPQLFKQLLMVSGFDKYFQIVKCFRDEDFRADRQPEFTQIDCEMSFVEQEDVLLMFEELIKHLFQIVKGLKMEDFLRLSYSDAIRLYGSDKPDIRFDVQLVEIKDLTLGKGFLLFEQAEYVGAICVKGGASYTCKQIDELSDFVRLPQVGADTLVYVRYNLSGLLKSSVDKFYSSEDLLKWMKRADAKPGDLILILSGNTSKTRRQLSALRLKIGTCLGLRDKNQFKCLWIVDFPLLEYDEENSRYISKHHPFTSPRPEDIPLLKTRPDLVRACAYDLVINGVEVGGGSIRIHTSKLQKKIFSILGFSEEDVRKQFGFLMNAFEYGAPPHGGIAFGLDRLVALFTGLNAIRDCIAFPKNNSGRDVMISAPSPIPQKQWDELHLKTTKK